MPHIKKHTMSSANIESKEQEDSDSEEQEKQQQQQSALSLFSLFTPTPGKKKTNVIIEVVVQNVIIEYAWVQTTIVASIYMRTLIMCAQSFSQRKRTAHCIFEETA